MMGLDFDGMRKHKVSLVFVLLLILLLLLLLLLLGMGGLGYFLVWDVSV